VNKAAIPDDAIVSKLNHKEKEKLLINIFPNVPISILPLLPLSIPLHLL
jgi:hypothetical protein